MSFRREGTLKVSNIPREAYPVDVEEAIAEAYHAAIPMWVQRPDYDSNPSRPNGPQNFELILHEDHKSGQLKGTGMLYLPAYFITFLDRLSTNPVYVRGNELTFEKWMTSHKKMDHTTRNAILESPYVPRKERDRVMERRKAFEEDLKVFKLEWGREGFSPGGIGGPQQVFNVYFQYDGSQHGDLLTTLYFADELQMILIALEDRSKSENSTDLIRIPYAHIKSVERCNDFRPAVIFHLHSSVFFEQYPGGKGALPRPPRLQAFDDNVTRHDGVRLTGLNANHARVLPYCYRTLRVVLHDAHVGSLEKMLETAGLRTFGDWNVRLDGRKLDLDQFHRRYHVLQGHMRALPFAVAFQIESMLFRGLLDPDQLQMMVDIVKEYEPSQSSGVANAMASFAQQPHLISRDSALLDSDILMTFKEHLTTNLAGSGALPTETKLGWFSCHRVTLTPTSKRLQGPFLDQGNRIIRRYDRKYWNNFIRVHFTDENGVQVKWDRNTDLERFLQTFIGEPLRNGITVGGRHFEFLLCSNSSLREHAVWFLEPFDSNTAESIRASIGCFTEPKPELVYQPAKLLARMGQALSATDPTVTLKPCEVEEDVEDIERNDSVFTDGLGDISQQLADEVWHALNPNSPRESLPRTPVAFQIRIAGAKGVVAINHTLRGRLIRLRNSMIKFKKSALDPYDVEVAKWFLYPTPCYLNRPLAMILDHLSVDHEAIVSAQYQVLMEASRACTIALGSLARMVEQYGLGRPFKFNRLLCHLIKGGLHYRDLFQDSRPATKFFERVGDAILVHLKRDVKHRARIPLPNSYTLVGVADVHGYLKPAEVFIAIQDVGDSEPKYIEGEVWISRSPAVHPGDIQRHYAIGEPPPDSPFAIQPLLNCLVFSVTASRAPASELGGGDLDGDLFQVICDPLFFPKRAHEPAEYPKVVPHKLPREVQIGDLIDTIISWILHDRLGLIATNHLIIADQSPRGLDDPKCMKLAELHSKAVDFSKSGQPVDFKEIPKFGAQCKPDWNRKASTQSSTMHYQSARVIGKLFRQVKLEEKAPRSTEQFSMDGEEPQEHPFLCILKQRLCEVFNPESGFNSILEKTARSGWEKELRRISTKYQSELASIQTLHSLSDQPLTEEEVFVGVHLSQASERRLQDDLRARMRLITGVLVERVLAALRGNGERVKVRHWVARSWLAWNLFYASEEIGHQSFSWIAMLSFFDALDVHEGRRRDPTDPHQPSPGWPNESEGIEEMVDEAGDEEEVSLLAE